MDDKKKNMLSMLQRLGGDSADSFSSYIPYHYAEVYSMYKLLADANIDHDDIEFLEPKTSGQSAFIFVCKFDNDSDVDKLDNYLIADDEVQYLRNNRFTVSIKRQRTCTNIKFKHA